MNKPAFQERISQKIYFFEFDLGRCVTRLFGLLKVKKKTKKLGLQLLVQFFDGLLGRFLVIGDED